MQQTLLLMIGFSIASAHVSRLDLLQPHITIASTVHNTPSAVSHQSFTRIHNHPLAQDSAPAAAALPNYDLETPTVRYTAHTTHAAPVVQGNTAAAAPASAIRKSGTPIVETLTHTPAHLTYATSPVVFQTLPHFKSM